MLALEGIRVLDLSQVQQGPGAAAMLADMGAEVIKVEPRWGELGRGVSVSTHGLPIPSASVEAFFFGWNRNKKGLAVDLTKEKGKEILIKLIKTSDVLVHSFTPDTVKKLGLEYEAVAEQNPRIIYAVASAYGLAGPDSQEMAFDLLGQAVSGLITQIGAPDGPPQSINTPICDRTASMQLAYGIVVALLARERLGIGQQVETSLLGAGIALQEWNMNYYLLSGQLAPRSSRGLGLVSGLFAIFEAKDGWLALAGVGDPRWPAFCRALGIEHLRDDPRFATANDRARHQDELVGILDQVFPTKSRDEWLRLLRDAGQVVAPVNGYAEVAGSPQVLANNYICEVDDPRRGRLKVVGVPVKLSKTPGKIRGLYPQLGEHTSDILLELGYSWEEIATLTSEEVVGYQEGTLTSARH